MRANVEATQIGRQQFYTETQNYLLQQSAASQQVQAQLQQLQQQKLVHHTRRRFVTNYPC